MKKLVINICLCVFLFSTSNSFAQTENEPDLNESMEMMQEQMERLMQQFSQDGNTFLFTDTLFAPGPIDLDSLMQGFSFSTPKSPHDSLMLGADPFFGTDIQEQLNQMFKSLDDIDPQYFKGLEDMMRQFDQNGIRPYGEEMPPTKDGKVKKKIYKI